MIYHLFDTTLGGCCSAACGSESDRLKLSTDFKELKSGEQCKECKTEYDRAEKMPGPAGSAEINSPQQMLPPSTSGLTYLLSRCIETSRWLMLSACKAIMITAVLMHERSPRHEQNSETISRLSTSRLMLRSDGANSAILGEAYVAEYLIVQK